jgi:hypothetical protein
MDPSTDDHGIPEITFITDGSFATLTRCSKYLETYRAGWMAVFFNFTALMILAVISWVICSTAGTDLNKWPWWLYVFVLVLALPALYFLRNFVVYLYDSVRWLPEAVQIKRTKNLLMLKWRAQTFLHGKAVWNQMMKEVESKMDPETVDDLRKWGFL